MAETKQDTAATVELTAEAAEKAREFMAGEDLLPENAGLRVSVLPGGCSGFQYGLNMLNVPLRPSPMPDKVRHF